VDPEFGAAIGSLSNTLTFVRTAIVPVDSKRLELEVRCYTMEALDNGAIIPRVPDLAACRELGTN
jgi:hypothetical protein